MIIIISPAKSMNMNKIDLPINTTQPIFKQEIAQIIERCMNLSQANLQKLMGISEKLADLNHQRFQNFADQEEKAALFAFNGDVYTSIDKENYAENDLLFASKHLRVLSGLYGVLRPFDLIRPYRLEMGTKLTQIASKGMDKYWQNNVTTHLKSELNEHKHPVLINLASNEYAAAVDFKALGYPYINIHFREIRNGVLKNIAFNSKRARGMAVDFIIKNQIDKPEDVQKFDYGEYNFDSSISDEYNFYFVK